MGLHRYSGGAAPADWEGEYSLTPQEMFELLTPENREKVIHLIETLAASQSSDPPEPDSPR